MAIESAEEAVWEFKDNVADARVIDTTVPHFNVVEGSRGRGNGTAEDGWGWVFLFRDTIYCWSDGLWSTEVEAWAACDNFAGHVVRATNGWLEN